MYNVYALRDSKSDSFNIPFHLQTDGLAVRALQDLVNDERSIVHAHPEDFALYCLATWDSVSGEYMPCAPRHVANALGFVAAKGSIEDTAVDGDIIL